MTLMVNDRYSLRRLLGSGGMGRVYLAQDKLENGVLLALKTLAPTADAVVDSSHLSQEFLVLADLDHPHLVRVFDFDHVRHVVGEPAPGEPDEVLPTGLPFFTCEFVSGVPLLTASARLSTNGILRLMLELTGALAYLHRQDLLHRDLKPDNILVSTNAGDGRQSRAKILDFGLSGLQGVDAPAVGNPRYLAPELLMGAPADTRAELYALGLIFFEIFAGEPPFSGETTAALARAQAQQAPPPLPIYVPTPVRDIVMRMLAKDPTARPTAEEVSRALQQALTSPEDLTASFWSAMGTPRLTGRERELELIEEMLDELAGRVERAGATRPRALILTGPPGIGKTRLMQALRHRAQVRDVRFLSASCQPGADAFAGVRALLRPLMLERPDLMTPEREVLRTVLSDRPTTRVDHRTADMSPFQAMVRIHDAARGLIETIAQEQPVVLVLEDMHWADPESLDLFQHLLAHLPAPSAMLVGTAWPPGQTDSPVDRLLAGIPHIPGQASWHELEGLDANAVSVLLHRTIGLTDPSPALVEQLRARTEGNPLFLEEILKLSRGAQTLEQLLENDLLPGAVNDAFRMQILAMSDDALAALKGLAVWGTPASSVDLAAVTRQDRTDCLAGLEEAAAAQLVRWQGTGYWFWHNVLVVILDELMTGEEAAELHRRAGKRREAAGELIDPERIGRLVTHFSRAGDAPRALGYALTGARLAEERFLARRAVELYERARELGLEAVGRTLGGTAGLIEVRERLAKLYAWTGAYARAESEATALLEDLGGSWDPAARTRLRALLGDIATRRGDFDTALSRFESALADCSDPLVAADLLDRIAEVHLRRGHHDDSQKACERALERLDMADAPVLRASIAAHLGKCFQQKGDFAAALNHFTEARALYTKAGYLPGMASTINAIAQVHNYQVQYGLAREAFLEALQLQEQLGDVEGVAVTLDRLALATWGMLDTQAALTYGRRSLDAWRRLGSAQGEAKTLTTLGIIHHSRGAYGEALTCVSEAMELQRKSGDDAGLLLSYQNTGIFYYEVGALDDARTALEAALELAVRSGSKMREARCSHILGVIAAARGDTARAREHLDSAAVFFRSLDNKEFLSDLISGYVEIDLKERDLVQARQHADEAVNLVLSLGQNPMLMQARMVAARVALQEPGSDLHAVMTELEEAEPLAGELNAPDLMWQLWEVKGRVALRLGRPREAVRLLTRSMDVIQACFKQLPRNLKVIYVNDARRLAVRSALEEALAIVRGAQR